MLMRGPTTLVRNCTMGIAMSEPSPCRFTLSFRWSYYRFFFMLTDS